MDALEFEAQARAGGRQALAGGDPATGRRGLLAATPRSPAGAARRWPMSPAGSSPPPPAARLAELRGATQLDRIEAELALGAGRPRPDRRTARADRGRPARGAPGPP